MVKIYKRIIFWKKIDLNHFKYKYNLFAVAQLTIIHH